MPGYLLHLGATMICPHMAGQARPIIVPNTRVKVNGQAVLTILNTFIISGCPNPTPPVNVGPCVTARWILGATRVRASGTAVLLRDSLSLCVPTPAPLRVLFTQTRVKGI